jgi:hypothetical protein
MEHRRDVPNQRNQNSNFARRAQRQPQVCKFHIDGCCTKGDQCRFLHPPAEPKENDEDARLMALEEKAMKNEKELEFWRKKQNLAVIQELETGGSSSAGVPKVVQPMMPPAMEPPAGVSPVMMQPPISNDQRMLIMQFETLSQPHKDLVQHIVGALSQS